MRIMIIASEFPPGPGGIGAHAYNLALYLVDKAHQVTVYTADRPAYSASGFDRDQPMDIHRYPTNSNKLKRFFHLIQFLWNHKNDFDWIILSGQSNLVLYHLIVQVIRSRIFCIVHGHEIIMARGVSQYLVRNALRKSTSVVTVSDFSKRLLQENGISRSVTTIPNGVTVIKGVKPKTHTKNKLVLITVGSVTKRKGQHNVVAALPEIIKRFGRVEYHIVGIPREREAIESLARELGVVDSIFLHSAASDEQRNEYLSQSDIFMMLSENQPDGDVEGFGIAVLEANGFGLPAIGSKDTGVEQAIQQGISGYLVDARNPDQICNSIGLILNEYEKFSQESIGWAHQHDWEIIGKKYLDILNEDHR